ncbi:hypothetical protein CFIO01_09916 [Colletotrichum fioriniae PJ7]|uniref:Uncharacterized protein n=1 Tax=Colletotrichum fioriniae PJ7 TaxID=1445577 RepID=A0A010S5V2_9PEZI|nr:hypothetical protein CFIO01_09916 [Colletotrichum fioriniae PJ7]
MIVNALRKLCMRRSILDIFECLCLGATGIFQSDADLIEKLKGCDDISGGPAERHVGGEYRLRRKVRESWVSVHEENKRRKEKTVWWQVNVPKIKVWSRDAEVQRGKRLLDA